jgi:hypothetical protein
MASVTLTATPNGNGYQATLAYSTGVSLSSAEVYPTIEEAIRMAAFKLLRMPKRLEAFDQEAAGSATSGSNVIAFSPAKREDAPQPA